MKLKGIRIIRLIEFALSNIVLLIIVLFLALPIPWLILSSINSEAKPYYSIPKLTFENYWSILTDPYLGKAFVNSLLISASTATFTTIICSISAYALSWISNTRKNLLIYSMLLLMLLPFTALMVPIYSLFIMLNLTNTYLGVILVISAFEVPFCTWIMKGYLEIIPKDLEEAAWLDGCSSIMALFRIVLPLSFRGLIVVAIISFTAAWNEYMIPLILLSNNNMFPAAVVLSNFILRGGANKSVLKYSVGDLAAFTVLYTLPTIVMALILRKNLIKIISGGIKL